MTLYAFAPNCSGDPLVGTTHKGVPLSIFKGFLFFPNAFTVPIETLKRCKAVVGIPVSFLCKIQGYRDYRCMFFCGGWYVNEAVGKKTYFSSIA